MIKLFYIQVKKSDKDADIVFWEKDIKLKSGKPLNCLAFFYKKQFAEQYLKYLESENEFMIKYEIKHILNNQNKP